MDARRAEQKASIERVQAAVAEINKALVRVWDTRGTAEANDALLAMGPVRKEFNEARHEMTVLLQELKAGG